MMATGGADWSGTSWDDWADAHLIRARLDAGADPNAGVHYHGRPLHAAAELGSPEVIAELAARVDDVDAEHQGHTALWRAVFANRPDNALALLAAGADPWRPMMSGWTPGRLSLASPTPDLFPLPPGRPSLSAAETAAVAEARRLIDALGELEYEGLGLVCVAGIGMAEAVRRLEAEQAYEDDDEYLSSSMDFRTTVGITEVPGGCVVSQQWGALPCSHRVLERLSAGTVCYALYANPSSGDQGSIARDGVVEQWDTHPGSGIVSPDASAEDILTTYLYHHQAVAYCCAAAGLRMTSGRAITGLPDDYLRIPANLG
ncbi:ankyrin repeat domain-containing protein [Nonomuraea sp. NPDC049141]|uniref:ankyrin repeat domain-containing protein n=1 Tax=Nonomuraea sp. NPDC049141 TaxID=3155500 RepID=UPI0033D82FB2